MSNNIVTTMRQSTGNLEALQVVAQNSAEYPLAHCEMCIRGVTSACMSHFRCLFHLPRRSGIIIDLQLAIGMFEDNLIIHLMMPSAGVVWENWLQHMQTIFTKKCSVYSLQIKDPKIHQEYSSALLQEIVEKGNHEVGKTTTERRSIDITVQESRKI